jgi:hypothetical protein
VTGATGGAPVRLEHAARVLAGATCWKAGQHVELCAAVEADLNAAHASLDDYDRHICGQAVIRAAKEALV